MCVVVFHSVGYAFRYSIVNQSDIASVSLSICWIGWIGVPLFFVISGYCIAASVDNEVRKCHSGFASFMYRRFRRIFPPYWFALMLLSVAGFVSYFLLRSRFLIDNTDLPFIPPWWKSWWQILGNVSLTETWRWHLVGDSPSLILGVAWTLCYEEQFYLLMGLMLLATKGRGFYVLVSLCSLVSFLLMEQPFAKGWFFDGFFLMFAVGVFSYFFLVNTQYKHLGVLSLSILVAISSWSCAFSGVDVFDANDVKVSLSVSLVFGMVLILLHPLDRLICSYRTSKVLMILGQRCYSMYLVHFPIVILFSSYFFFQLGWTSPFATLVLTVPICLLVTFLSTEVFYRLIEVRFLNPSNSGD